MKKHPKPGRVAMKGSNGDRVSLVVRADGAAVLLHVDRKGKVLARTCSGSCDGVTVGPIDCPEGSSPVLNCVSNPPTISCKSTKKARRK